MFEKVILAVALACSLYLNLQFKPPQRTIEVGTIHSVEIIQDYVQAAPTIV
ncbi:hypothetical protein [Chamaesiphon minutus]|uniref:Uncharacterized protein n=1 Tax=Chamaesiphon minutus (strain ATCC 27169 / PCC 6605) TaxID=1173020 RepID=K9UPD4_CHAP6|nr:hypothetical protein [Chamaesiphon minutus]AFY96064.1 hypothetical protein Cha6605_5170 [Chamaesiphon minutus PCC 6605]